MKVEMMSVKSSVPEAAGCSEPVHVWTDPAAVLGRRGRLQLVWCTLEMFVQPFSNKESHRQG